MAIKAKEAANRRVIQHTIFSNLMRCRPELEA